MNQPSWKTTWRFLGVLNRITMWLGNYTLTIHTLTTLSIMTSFLMAAMQKQPKDLRPSLAVTDTWLLLGTERGGTWYSNHSHTRMVSRVYWDSGLFVCFRKSQVERRTYMKLDRKGGSWGRDEYDKIFIYCVIFWRIIKIFFLILPCGGG